MVKAAIVLLNWNGWKDTLDCLKSIEKLHVKNISLKTFVVDNGSTNDSVEQIEKYLSSHTDVDLIKNHSNLGFAEGNNVGIRQALKEKYEFIIVLNNDTILHVDIVHELISFMNEHPSVGACSPKMYFAKGFEFHKDRYTKSDKGKVIWYAGGDIDWKNVYGSNHGVDEVDYGQFATNYKTQFGSGACLCLRSNALRKVGLFDSNYFLYFEDTDLCMRLQKYGYEVYFVSKAILWHKVSQGSAIGSKLNDYFITRNRLLFASKYANLRANIALFRESIRFMMNGREWQVKGARDFYLHRFGKGSWKN